MSHSATETMQWWVMRDGAAQGPFTPAYIVLGLRTGSLSADVLACPAGGQQWRPLLQWPAFQSSASATQAVSSDGSLAQLPEFAKWIRYYCLFASPAFFFGGLLQCVDGGFAFVPESPLFVAELLVSAISTLLQLVAAAILIFGAIELPSRTARSVRLLQLGLLMDLLNGIAFFIAILFLMGLAMSEPGHVAETKNSVFDLLLPFQLAALALEAAALVWLVLRFETLTRPAVVR